MIGLIGGLGVGAAIHYYRELAAAHDDQQRPLDLVMIHASITRTMAHASTGDRQGLASYLAGLLAPLKAAGATIGVIPAVTPHLCIDELKGIAPIPVVDILEVVANEIHQRKLSRVALFGTRFVVDSDLFGRLHGVDVVRPKEAEVAFVHETYSQLARTGSATAEQRQQLVALADTLQTRDDVEAIVLAGTDFSLIFDASNTPFPHLDCARAHIARVNSVHDSMN